MKDLVVVDVLNDFYVNNFFLTLCLRGVMEIVADGHPITKKTIEFDIDNLPNKIARELERYVKQCLMMGNKKKKGSGKQEINLEGIKQT